MRSVSDPREVPAPFGGAAALLWNVLFTTSPIPQAIVDQSGRFVRANRAFGELVERTTAELEGLRFAEITHPDDVAADLEMVDRCLHGDAPGYRMAKRYRTPYGRDVWAQLTVHVVTDTMGRFACFHSSVIGIEMPVSAEIQSDGKVVLKPDIKAWRAALSDPKQVLAVGGAVVAICIWVITQVVDYQKGKWENDKLRRDVEQLKLKLEQRSDVDRRPRDRESFGDSRRRDDL